MTEKQIKNKELCEYFPFLYPTYPQDEYNYEWTELDQMPEGWRKAFGEQMCEEILTELITSGLLDEYKILQIKEKYGQLCWYASPTTQRIEEIIQKYSNLSKHICINCGCPATQVSITWISPWCDQCAKDVYGTLIPIEKWFEGE